MQFARRRIEDGDHLERPPHRRAAQPAVVVVADLDRRVVVRVAKKVVVGLAAAVVLDRAAVAAALLVLQVLPDPSAEGLQRFRTRVRHPASQSGAAVPIPVLQTLGVLEQTRPLERLPRVQEVPHRHGRRAVAGFGGEGVAALDQRLLDERPQADRRAEFVELPPLRFAPLPLARRPRQPRLIEMLDVIFDGGPIDVDRLGKGIEERPPQLGRHEPQDSPRRVMLRHSPTHSIRINPPRTL